MQELSLRIVLVLVALSCGCLHVLVGGVQGFGAPLPHCMCDCDPASALEPCNCVIVPNVYVTVCQYVFVCVYVSLCVCVSM